MPEAIFQSIAWESMASRTAGITVHRLEIHRHLRNTGRLGAHRHQHWQALLYLSGRGMQRVGGSEPVRVGPGSLLVLPPECDHAFVRVGTRPPFCVVLDFEMESAPSAEPFVGAFNLTALGRVRRMLAETPRQVEEARRPGTELRRAGVALEILGIALEETSWWGAAIRAPLSPLVRRVHGLLRDRIDQNETLRAVATQVGCSPDHLNRVLRQETGWSMGEWRNLLRLEVAERMLLAGTSVGETGAACGMPDQNYFARWFRRANGLAPTRWLRMRQGGSGLTP